MLKNRIQGEGFLEAMHSVLEMDDTEYSPATRRENRVEQLTLLMMFVPIRIVWSYMIRRKSSCPQMEMYRMKFPLLYMVNALKLGIQ